MLSWKSVAIILTLILYSKEFRAAEVVKHWLCGQATKSGGQDLNQRSLDPRLSVKQDCTTALKGFQRLTGRRWRRCCLTGLPSAVLSAPGRQHRAVTLQRNRINAPLSASLPSTYGKPMLCIHGSPV